VSELQIEQDLEFQRRSWTIQRIGWMIMGAALVAALLGFFGRGPFSHDRVGGPSDPVQLEYERLVQYESGSTLTLRLQPPGGKIASVWIDRDYLTRVHLDGIVPAPERTELSSDRVTYLFAVSPSDQPVVITIRVRSQEIGTIHGRIGVAGGEALPFRQFVFP
jgi:hypothetical protein